MDEWIESDSGNYSMALSQTRESLRLCRVRLWNPFDCACASRFRFGNCTIALIQARKQYDCGESYSAYNTSACVLCITVYNTRAYVLCITVYNRLSKIQFTIYIFRNYGFVECFKRICALHGSGLSAPNHYKK